MLKQSLTVCSVESGFTHQNSVHSVVSFLIDLCVNVWNKALMVNTSAEVGVYVRKIFFRQSLCIPKMCLCFSFLSAKPQFSILREFCNFKIVLRN